MELLLALAATLAFTAAGLAGPRQEQPGQEVRKAQVKPRIDVVRKQAAQPGLHPKAPTSAPASAPVRGKKAGCGSNKGRSRPSIPKPAPEGPYPKWVCDAVTKTVEPVWKGQRIKVTYKISNEGQADLKILAKGG